MNASWWVVLGVGVIWIALARLRSPVELPPGDDEGTLVRLVAMGHRIEAIRRYRALHGGGLKEAKEAVEQLAQGRKAIPLEPRHPGEVGPEVMALVQAGRTLEAIKAYREAHPEADLSTAKAMVEALGRNG